MRALLALSFLLSFSLTQKLEALELYTKTLSGDAPANWSYIYSEDKRWVVEQIALDATGWPVLRSRHIYENEKLARVAFLAMTATDIKMSGIPEEGKELVDPAGDTLWTVSNQWSWDWEVKYSEWVKSELDTGWWKRHGLATDCADVAYSAKWIFARNNGLPMANRLGNGQWFTYKSVKPEWKRLPHAAEWYNDKKFLAGLNFFLDFVFTHSLWNDSYPIAINAESLRPGAHHLSLHDRSGHTQLVYRVGTQPDEVPVSTLNSTIPRDVRDLWEYLFYSATAKEDSEAFLRIRWPQWAGEKVSLVDPTLMPYYSKEQFDPSFIQAPRTQFWEEVFHRVNPNVDMSKVALRALTQVKDLMQARIQIVEDGYQACSGNRCPEGSALWETWSTPSRDARISAALDLLSMVSNRLEDSEILRPLYETQVLSQEGYTFTLADLVNGWYMRSYSSDPNMEPVVRWGVHPRGIALNVQNTIAATLKNRQARIDAGGTCKTVACAFDSEKYSRESTFEFDRGIWSASDLPGEYCQRFNHDMCLELRNRLNQMTLAADGRTLGIYEWLREGVLFNSDPRNTKPRRYYSYTKDFPHFVMDLGGLNQIDEYAGRLLMLYSAGSAKLYALNGLEYQEWSAPSGEELKALDPVQGWIWTVQGPNLFVRRMDSVQTFAFPFSGSITALFARNGHAFLYDGAGPKILTIDAATGISAQALDPSLSAFGQPTQKGYLTFQKNSTEFAVLDIDGGELLQVPAAQQLASISRAGGGQHILRYYRAGAEGFSCAVISKNAPIVLNVDNDCVVADAAGYAVLAINGMLYKRTFNNWHFMSDILIGEYRYLQNERLYLVENHGQLESYCANANGVIKLPSTGAKGMYYECNNRFASAYEEGQPWRVVDIASGTTVLQVKGWATMVSADPNERYFLVNKSANGREIALMDMDHLEKFSLLSDQQMYAFPNLRVERTNGFVVYKNGHGVWLNAPL